MHCSSKSPLLGSPSPAAPHTTPACRAFTAFSPAAPATRTTRGRARQLRSRAVGDFFRDLFDFNSWAPKSTRIWRLQQYEPPEASEAADAGASGGLDVLQARINQLRDSQDSPSPAAGPSSPSSSSSSSGGGASSSRGASVLDRPPLDGGDDDADATASFSDADDADVSAALNQRIRQIATTTGEWGSSVDEEEMRQPLTGEEVRLLLLKKYGKQYDLSFVRRNLPGMGAVVSLNIMWLHLEQASFRMSPAQYMEKLDSVASLVNVLGQTDKVRAFLRAPAKSMKGLPRRPVVGTAISIRMDLSREQVAEWFGAGYD